MIEWLAGFTTVFRRRIYLLRTCSYMDLSTPTHRSLLMAKALVHSTVRRKQKGEKAINAAVVGNLGQTVTSGYNEDRAVLKSKGTGKFSVNAVEYCTDMSNAKVELTLGTKKAYKTLKGNS